MDGSGGGGEKEEADGSRGVKNPEQFQRKDSKFNGSRADRTGANLREGM